MKAILTLLIWAGLVLNTLAQPTLIPYRKGVKWGYVTPQLKRIIPLLYDEAYPFSEGLARIRQGKYYGFINANGKVVIPFVYDNAADYQERYDPLTETTSTEAIVVKAGKRFAILLNGRPVKARSYLAPEVGMDQELFTKTDSLTITDWPNGQKAFQHLESHIITGPFIEIAIDMVAADPVTGRYNPRKGPRYVVAGQTPEGWELYTGSGKRLPTDRFDEVTITPMMVIVQKNGRFGAVNPLTGAVRLPIQYDSLYYRAYGDLGHCYLIKENGKWGTLDIGPLTVPIEYDDVQMVVSLDRPAFITRSGSRYGFIGPDGTLPPRYEWLELATPDLLRVKRNGRYGYTNLAGREYFED